MLPLESPDTSIARIQIDQDVLLRQLPSLIVVKRKRRTWDEHGEKVARYLLPDTERQRTRVDHEEFGSDISVWQLAKELVHAAITSEDAEYAAIQKRLGDWRSRPTAALLSTLGLWTAGTLGISVTVTGPMLATMLYGVAEADGNWEILLGPARSGNRG